MTTQARLLHIADVAPINADRAAVNVVEAREQVHHRGLSRARRADQGDRLPRPGDQARILDDRHVRHVAEVHEIEDHLAGDVVQRHSVGYIGEFRRCVNDL